MSTINKFVRGEFPLSQLEYLLQLDGLNYGALPRSMQRRINETQLVVNIIEPGTPEDVMFNIFRRINTGGMTLKGQEIRNALHRGPVRQYLKELAESEEFLDATVRSIRTTRMADRECVLRFLAFYIDQWEDYGSNDLDGYLSQAMTKINGMTSEQCDAIAKDFKKAMRAACDIFGQDSFRRRFNRSDSRRPVSKALFEAWSVRLARCSPEQLNILYKKREEVIDRFITLMNEDNEFDNAISYSTRNTPTCQKALQHDREVGWGDGVMLSKIKLLNFKCFQSLELSCAPLTLLCGLNGRGKSSVIQALLVLRQSYSSGDLTEGRLVPGRRACGSRDRHGRALRRRRE